MGKCQFLCFSETEFHMGREVLEVLSATESGTSGIMSQNDSLHSRDKALDQP